jgi:Ran GTPase-activating protein (RanGAP) involved in mRNA processing and transport
VKPNTGQPGGRKTGQNMTHYIIESGRYEQAFTAMPAEFILPFTSLEGDLVKLQLSGSGVKCHLGGTESAKTGVATGKKTREKTKYTCFSCGTNAWGKPDLNLLCGDCNERLQPVSLHFNTVP